MGEVLKIDKTDRWRDRIAETLEKAAAQVRSGEVSTVILITSNDDAETFENYVGSMGAKRSEVLGLLALAQHNLIVGEE